MASDIEPIEGPPARLPVAVCRTQAQLGEVRAETTEAGGSVRVMEGHFSRFGNWYEINSVFEGQFLERISPGAFKKTFNDDAGRKNAGEKIKCLLEHGHDPQVADKPLGVPRKLAEDGDGAAYEVPLLDTSYVRDLIPALEAGAYGSSFRFRVLQDEWVEEPEPSADNPKGIPERTLKEVKVMEFGPTMFPANSESSAALRSTTDEYYASLRSRRPEEFEDAMRSVRETRESVAAARAAATETIEPGRSDSCRCESGTLCYCTECACPGAVSVQLARSEFITGLVDQGYDLDKVTEWANTQDRSKPLSGVPYAVPDKQSITAPAAGPAVTDGTPKATTPGAAAPSTTTEPRKHSAGNQEDPTRSTRSAAMDELTMTVQEREQRQGEIRTRLQEIDAEYNGAALPEERQTEWDSISSEFEEHTHAIRAANARASRLAALAGSGSTEEGTPFTPPNVIVKRPENVYDITSLRRDARSVDDLARLMRDNALRAVEMSHYDSVDNEDECRTHIEKLLRRVDDKDGTIARSILQTGSDTYDRAFGKACMAGSLNGLNNEERAALAVGATTTGGFAVPFSLDPTVILTDSGVVNPIRQIARVVTIAGKQWQGVTSAGITVSRAAEAAEAGDNSPTIAQPTVTPTRVQGFVPFSFEIDQDWTQMRGELATMFTEAKDTEEATSFVIGDGISPNPEGVVVGVAAVAGSVVRTLTATAVVVADLYSAVDGLPPRHTPNASWLANKKFYNIVRQIDSAGGSALWARLAEGRPSRLVDYPVYEASTMTGTPVIDANLALLGDFKKFLIVDRVGMSVELIPHLFHTGNNRPSGQRGLYAIWRNSSKVLDPNAFRLVKGKAS
jgi:HK97 family phage major capsid protein/HK97 family phage prohead protease